MSTRRLDRLLDAALTTWADWYLANYMPPKLRTKRVMDLACGWDHTQGFGPQIRAPGTHSNPVLAKLVASESHGTSWAESIHNIICDMHRTHQIMLFARAFDHSREVAARQAGIKLTSVPVAESLALSRLRISLASIEHVRRGQMQQRHDDAQEREYGKVA